LSVIPRGAPSDIDTSAPPFDQLSSVRRLAANRSGRDSDTHARHHLYVGRDKRTRTDILVKLTTKPGLIYEHNLLNEIASLEIINRERPHARYFPVLLDHGRLGDGRVYLSTYLFEELPLATAIDAEPVPAKMVAHLRTAIEISRVLMELHSLEIVHVDLNPMNILRREEAGWPVIRIVDFESSYAFARHSTGIFYNPPTTPGYTAPEVAHQAPDARADLYSLGAVLYTMLAGYEWTLAGDVREAIASNATVDSDLRRILLKAVALDPDRRHASAADLQRALTAYLEQIWPGRPGPGDRQP